MRFGLACVVTLALVLAGAATADAQYIHGRVTELQTGEGVASASVLVVAPDRSVRAGGVTDSAGRFSFRIPPGTFTLRVQRSGYATTGSLPIDATPRDTLDFAVKLPLRPRQIDPLTVTAEGAPLDPSGFFERRADSPGRFLGPYEVERRRPGSPADLLHDIPGFQLTPSHGGFRVLMTGRNRRCEPTVYVDGTLAHRGTQTDRLTAANDQDGVHLETLVNANLIRAMEAYQSGAIAPVRFRPVGPIGGGDCGVLVFWTRVGFGR